jgi:tetratricopeptide (TPR) repeat protein
VSSDSLPEREPEAAAADPLRESIARDLEKNVLLQYAFSKAAQLSRGGQLAEAAAEYAKIAGAAGKPQLRALAYVLQAEMLLRDPPTVLDTARAREALEQAHALGPPAREWTFTLGMLALRDEHLAEARDLLSRSFAMDHQPQEAAAFLAVVEARSGDGAAGRQWLELARENGDAWRSPEAEIALRDPADPVAALRAAADEHPEEYWLRLALARELTTAGRHEELVDTTRAMASDPELPQRFRATAALGAARALLLHAPDDRVDEALKLAAQARTLAPKSLAVWEVLSLGYCRQEHYRRAAGAARRVLRAEPESIIARYVQAWALAGRGSCDRARAALSEAVQRDPEWPLREKAADAVSGCR